MMAVMISRAREGGREGEREGGRVRKKVLRSRDIWVSE
jgi:hypothetical protein